MIHSPVLVLNRSYLPIHVTSVKRALSLLYRGIAKALNEQFAVFDFHSWMTLPLPRDGVTIGLVNRSIRVPRVILLTAFDRQPRKSLRFSRPRVLARDRYTCQYCGKTAPPHALNLDHVIPRRYGGETNWENVVCCCLRCNLRKGGRTPDEAGLRLIRPPRAPSYLHLTQILPRVTFFEEWRPFLIHVDRTYAPLGEAKRI